MISSSRYILQNKFVDGSIRARDRHLERDVVLKPWWNNTDRSQLQRTIKVLTELQCNHIADVYDIQSMSDGSLAVVEEFLDGRTISDWETRQNTGSDVLRILYQMAGALAALHAQDLSPPSIAVENWRFDAENILNLSVFSPPDSATTTHGNAIGPTVLRQAHDLQALATLAKRFADRFLVNSTTASSTSSDPHLADLWAGQPASHRTAQAYYDRLRTCLLRGRHRAMVVYRGQSAELNATRQTLRLTHPVPAIAQVTIHYDGEQFLVSASTGEAYLNNSALTPLHPIPGSCVLTLGAANRPWSERHFITIDISHPEVVL